MSSIEKRLLITTSLCLEVGLPIAICYESVKADSAKSTERVGKSEM